MEPTVRVQKAVQAYMLNRMDKKPSLHLFGSIIVILNGSSISKFEVDMRMLFSMMVDMLFPLY